ncbi:unnamed protein product, partial [Brugia timori]|uniref:Copper-binding protein n=1 Tax=Brugia timori TaxID=42155 RepID=A0A0R3QS35_9BILA
MDHHNQHMNHNVSNAINISASVMDHSAHTHHADHHCSTSHMHAMSFHFGSNETVLFSFWTINSSTVYRNVLKGGRLLLVVKYYHPISLSTFLNLG